MPRPGEQVAAAALFMVPEWAVLDGRCATCRYAMTTRSKDVFRCEQYNEPIKLDYSCEGYVPAPSLVEARRLARSGRATCREASY